LAKTEKVIMGLIRWSANEMITLGQWSQKQSASVWLFSRRWQMAGQKFTKTT